MSGYHLSAPALTDLAAIWTYYAEEVGDPDLADRMRDELFAGIRTVALTPGIGHYRSDLATEPVRFWRVRGYLVVYRGETSPVEIVRVLHGARDVRAILGRKSK